jgi:hypothetical protein
MSALTASRIIEFVGEQEEISPKVAASDIYYKGGILVYTSGYAAAPSDAANLEVAGIISGIYGDGDRVDAKTVGASTYPRAVLRRGKAWIPVSGCAQTDVGVIHYVFDDETMTKTAGSKTVGYRALDFKTGYLLFDFRNPDRIA